MGKTPKNELSKEKPRETIQSHFDPHQIASTYWSLPFKHRTYENAVAKSRGMEIPVKKGVVDMKDRDAVGRLMRQLEEGGDVLHLVLRGSGTTDYPLLVPSLEDELRRRYHLRDAAVVDIRSLKVPPSDTKRGDPAWMTFDDDIHRLIGIWGGRILASLMRSGDSIAVGGGRGPYYAVAHCRLPRGSSCCPRQVVSLSGSQSTQDWLPTTGEVENQDPDAIAMRLQGRIRAKEQPAIMNCSIADTQKKNSAVKGALANNITLALVGIGSLSGGHRFMNPSDELGKLKTIVNQLNGLVAKIDSDCNDPPFPSSVADLGNWFFVLPNSSRISNRKSLRPADRRSLEAMVNKLNSRLVNIDSGKYFPDICNRGAVLAVAGGRYKLDAIYDVLYQGRKNAWISHLVTDSWTAERLIAPDVPSPFD